MKVLLAASSAIAIPCLEALHRSGRLGGILCAPDAARGRGGKSEPNVVALRAAQLDRGIPILKPERLDESSRQACLALGCQALVAYSYGRLFGPKFLGLFPDGGYNVHPSLLPRWRGPTPIQAAILSGERQSGLTVQTLAREIDSGDIIVQRPIELSGREGFAELEGRFAQLGAEALLEALEAIESGRAQRRCQDHSQASYCHLIKKEDGLVDWSRPAEELDAMVRAYSVWPEAYCLHKGLRLALLESQAIEGQAALGPPGKVVGVDRSKGILVQTGSGLLALLRLQLEKKKPLGFKDFLNGTRDVLGAVLIGRGQQ